MPKKDHQQIPVISIQQVEIYKSPILLKAPFITSLGLLTHAENIIVVLRTSNGITGFGECSPFKTINGESMDTCFIVGQYLANALIGKDALDVESCSAIMDRTIYGNTSIKSAFDIALYDIGSQHAGLPLYAFLGGKNDKTLITDYTVSIDTPEKMAADAVEIKNNGFQVIKVKLGGTKEMDIGRIKQICQSIGTEIPLRIDANQGWQLQDAMDVLEALGGYNIQHCEEPIARWNYMELPKLRKLSPIPIMADESCCDHHDAERLIGLAACDMFNIKLGKSSGIFKARKIIALAEQAGMFMQLGGFLESRLGFTAAAHLGLTSEHILHYDFDTPLMFVEDPVTGGISYDRSGALTIPDTPGLGVAVDEKYLSGLTKVVISQ